MQKIDFQDIQNVVYRHYKRKIKHVNIALLDIDQKILFADSYYPEIENYENIYDMYQVSVKRNESQYIKTLLDDKKNYLYISKKNLILSYDGVKDEIIEATNEFFIKLLRNSKCKYINFFKIGTDVTIGFLLCLTKKPFRRIKGVNKFIQQHLLPLYLDVSIEKFEQQKSLIETNAKKAAIAVVMNRNMSHNLGSHVLAGLCTKETMRNIIKKYFDRTNLLFDYSGKDISSPDISLAIFNQHLRNRMDFLSDVTSSFSVAENAKYLFGEIIKPFKNNRILKSRIPGLAKWDYEIVISSEKTDLIEVDEKNDFCVSMPNDVLGIHAFYIILENFIRNCAKHEHQLGNVKINILKTDYQSDDFFKFIIFSNCSNDEIDDLVKNRQIDVDKEILKDGAVRPDAWGIMEMKIAAAYLRKISIEDVDKPNNPPLLQTCKMPDDTGKSLGYKFLVRKPKEILVSKEYFHKIDGVGIDAYGGEEKVFSHRIMLISLNDNLSYDKFNYPQRKLKISLTDKTGKLNTAQIWEFYVEELMKEKQVNEISCYLLDSELPDSNNTEDKLWFKKNIDIVGNKINAMFHLHCSGIIEQGYDYYEAYGSSTNLGLLLSKRNETSLLRFEIIESILTKVVIVDERIQSFVDDDQNINQNSGFENMRALFENINVTVTPEDINLNVKDFHNLSKSSKDSVYERLTEWIRCTISKESKIDFAILHLGILEKMYGSGKDKVIAILELFKDTNTKLIITSGRGIKPEEIPENIMFIPYSAISKYLIENRSKYHLTQLLYAARTKQ